MPWSIYDILMCKVAGKGQPSLNTVPYGRLAIFDAMIHNLRFFYEAHGCLPMMTFFGCMLLLPLNLSARFLGRFAGSVIFNFICTVGTAPPQQIFQHTLGVCHCIELLRGIFRGCWLKTSDILMHFACWYWYCVLNMLQTHFELCHTCWLFVRASHWPWGAYSTDLVGQWRQGKLNPLAQIRHHNDSWLCDHWIPTTRFGGHGLEGLKLCSLSQVYTSFIFYCLNIGESIISNYGENTDCCSSVLSSQPRGWSSKRLLKVWRAPDRPIASLRRCRPISHRPHWWHPHVSESLSLSIGRASCFVHGSEVSTFAFAFTGQQHSSKSNGHPSWPHENTDR